MLSKSQISYIKSLHLKKFRKQHGKFVVEGLKSILEFLHSDYVLDQLFYVPETTPKVAIFPRKIKLNSISIEELKKISTLNNPHDAIAIFEIPKRNITKTDNLSNKFSLLLDAVQDPGNLGTIIRTADWFGIQHIICSPDTADIYNPKVVQATMGSLARVYVAYTSLEEWLPQTNMKVYGAMLDGDSIYHCDFKSGIEAGGLLLLGNEGHGIRRELIPFIHQKITIPKFGGAESLNVAVAFAVICSELKSRD